MRSSLNSACQPVRVLLTSRFVAVPSIVRGLYESLLLVGAAKRMLRNDVNMSA